MDAIIPFLSGLAVGFAIDVIAFYLCGVIESDWLEPEDEDAYWYELMTGEREQD